MRYTEVRMDQIPRAQVNTREMYNDALQHFKKGKSSALSIFVTNQQLVGRLRDLGLQASSRRIKDPKEAKALGVEVGIIQVLFRYHPKVSGGPVTDALDLPKGEKAEAPKPKRKPKAAKAVAVTRAKAVKKSAPPKIKARRVKPPADDAEDLGFDPNYNPEG